MSTTQTTDAKFSGDVLKSDTPVLVDFWAEWCSPCKSIAPSLEELAGEMSDKLKVVKINIDENPETPQKYGVRGIPALLIFRDGEVIAEKIGAVSKSQLIQWVEESI